MRLINVKAFLKRESLIKEGKPVDRRTKVLEFGDDETTQYAILSHRWIAQEVDYDEMVGLAKMDGDEREEIRQRDGYQKILRSCEQAQEDGYEWLWVDTCCIDKRSSAELSEAINSMYRWYEKAEVCYAYLHDVPGSSFRIASDKERHSRFDGWPEWFSRGWTLQELIAPSNVQFFNKDWERIGDKRSHAHTLVSITEVPEHVLIHGLRGNRSCVAQIMSWAAHRKTTRVEDRAYSLMGLLDVNMPMLYGEGKKAFHRLQLEIIRASNDQSIFAWRPSIEQQQPGSILADDPSRFEGCGKMELKCHDELVQYIKENVPEEELDSIGDRLGTFPLTNRGIQIWMLLRPWGGSRSRFEAQLPCRGGPVTIGLHLWESNYYRCQSLPYASIDRGGPLQFRQVYLRYQDPPHHNTTFKIDDSALTENGFTFCDAYPKKFTENTFTLTSTDSLWIKVYSDSPTNHRFVLYVGQSFGNDWIHVLPDEPDLIPRLPWQDCALHRYDSVLINPPEHAQDMDSKARSGAERYGQVCIMRTRLPQTARILQVSSVMWKSSRMCGVKLEVFHDLGVGDVLGKWTGFDVDGTDDPGCDWRGLMILDQQTRKYFWNMNGAPVYFSATPNGIKLGDYGHFTDSKEFCCEGNLFTDPDSLALMADITPSQHEISSDDWHTVWNQTDRDWLDLYKPLILWFPRNDGFKSLLTLFSTRLTNRYLVKEIIQCRPDPRQPGSNITTSLYSVDKPFVWHRNETASSVLEK